MRLQERIHFRKRMMRALVSAKSITRDEAKQKLLERDIKTLSKEVREMEDHQTYQGDTHTAPQNENREA